MTLFHHFGVAEGFRRVCFSRLHAMLGPQPEIVAFHFVEAHALQALLCHYPPALLVASAFYRALLYRSHKLLSDPLIEDSKTLCPATLRLHVQFLGMLGRVARRDAFLVREPSFFDELFSSEHWDVILTIPRHLRWPKPLQLGTPEMQSAHSEAIESPAVLALDFEDITTLDVQEESGCCRER
jgi:hypothetical protein